jgi:hypothetical protein
MITRRERAKTQARIDIVLADIRRLEARGLDWVGAPAPIARAMLRTDFRRPTPIEIGLSIRSKANDMRRGTFAIPDEVFRMTAPRSKPPGPHPRLRLASET